MKNCQLCGVKADKKCLGCSSVVYCGKKHQKQDWSRHKIDCKPSWMMVEDPEGIRGHYLVSAADIKAGDIILGAEKPIVIGPHTSNPPPVCLGCFYPIHFVRERCTKCNVPLCEKGCEHAPLHADECTVIAERGLEEFLDYDIVTPLRAARLKRTDPESYRAIMALESNKEAKEAYETERTSLREKAQRLQRYLNEFDVEELIVILCILDTNTYQVLVKGSRETQNFACGLYLRAARLNHSCRPNTRPVFGADRSMRVMAVDDIPRGDEITTSYLEPFYTTYQRRSLLKRGKAFHCRCRRCLDPTELGSYGSAVRCNACREGWALPEDPASLASAWRCVRCRRFMTLEDSVRLDNKLIDERLKVNRGSVTHVEKFYWAYEPHLHPGHAFLMQLRQWMFEGLGRTPSPDPSELRTKLELGEALLNYFDATEGRLSFIRGVVLLEMTDALCKLASLGAGGEEGRRRAEHYLAEARQVFRHEDPRGLEAGMLVEGAEQLEVMLATWPPR